MGVEMPVRMGGIIRRCPMPAHGIGKGYLKEVIIAGQQALENLGQSHALRTTQIRETEKGTSGQE